MLLFSRSAFRSASRSAFRNEVFRIGTFRNGAFRGGVVAAALWCSACLGFDPVAQDLPRTSLEHPARLIALTIPSHGVDLNAIAYVADGPGPHPSALLLHGFPGNERNLDLAHAIRRSGWNVVFFHYRGAWGSGGDFSVEHMLEDVGSVVAWTRSADAAFRIDPDRIALVGHSMGGFAALQEGAQLGAVDCIVSIAGANLALLGRAAKRDPDVAVALAARLQSSTAPLRGTSGLEIALTLQKDPERLDLLRLAPALSGKPLLLIAGARDETTPPALHHRPLVRALEAVDARRLEHHELDADHAFSQRRIELARMVTTWLSGACQASLGKGDD